MSLTIIFVVVALTVLNIFNDLPGIGADKALSVSSDKEKNGSAVLLPDQAETSHLAQPERANRIQHPEGNNDIQIAAEDFFGAVFPGMIQDNAGDFAYESYREAKPGESLHVEDYFQKSPSSKLVPIISGDKVLAISVFRLFDGKTYTPARMIDMSDKSWDRFPPISQIEAESILLEQMPNSYMPQSGFVHLDGVSPNYQFVVPGVAEIIYLVNALTGDVNAVPKNFSLPEDAEEDPPVYFDKNGLLDVDREKVSAWSPERLAELKQDVEKSNAAIQAGLLKLGPDFEVIYDVRQRSSVISDR